MAKLDFSQKYLVMRLVTVEITINTDRIQHDIENHKKNYWDCDCFLAIEIRNNIEKRKEISNQLGIVA